MMIYVYIQRKRTSSLASVGLTQARPNNYMDAPATVTVSEGSHTFTQLSHIFMSVCLYICHCLLCMHNYIMM